MGRDMQVSDSVVIAADAQTIYDRVADPVQMSRWSPENTGATTSSAGRTLHEGEVFDGSNKRGRARWSTECVVTAAEPGRRFALRRTQDRAAYAVHPRPDRLMGVHLRAARRRHPGHRDLDRPAPSWPDWAAAIFDKAATGGRLFSDFQRRNIKRTLAAMKADFEGQATSVAC